MDINADFEELINQMDKLALELELPDLDFDLATLDMLDLDLPKGLMDFDKQPIKCKSPS